MKCEMSEWNELATEIVNSLDFLQNTSITSYCNFLVLLFFLGD